MTALQFSQLCGMLNPDKVYLEMSYKTHKHILASAGSISDPENWSDTEIPDSINELKVDHLEMPFMTVELVPTFTPRTRDGFPIEVELEVNA